MLRAAKEEIMSFTLIGEEREGGYTFITSPDLQGFTFMLEPDERNIEKTLDAIKPALAAYLGAYLRKKILY